MYDTSSGSQTILPSFVFLSVDRCLVLLPIAGVLSAHSRDMVVGSARVYSVFEDKRTLTSAEIEELYFAIGLNVKTIYKDA